MPANDLAQLQKIQEDFIAVDDILQSFGASTDSKLKIYKLLSVILHLSNVVFDESNNTCSVTTQTKIHLQISADLLGIETSELEQALLNQHIAEIV